ncbi:MAG: adenylosuccinate synthase, partial [Candidatus Scalindua sp.]|nr:adenylosuccinate synthase [Candidatus Scalindua sp.]
DVIVRYQGGGNAGHTLIIDDEKFIFHLIPSGILHPDKKCVIGNGIVFDPRLFLDEVAGLSKRNINVNGNLFVSDRAHVVFPYHKKLDLLIEKQKGNSMIGTTGRGIGPCYTDKIARDGIRVAELLHKEHFKEKLKKTVEEKNRLFVDLYKDEPVSWEEIYEEYCVYAEKISPFVCDTVDLMAKAIEDNKKILFEGAQGALLDVDFGTYPYTTSSNASAGGVSPGIGVSPKQIHEIIGITKAYATRVGSGPFPTEIDGEQGEHIRKKGGEFGSTTGRPRRCGWFDAVAIRHSVRISGVDSLIMTKMDVLDDQETIRICTGYKSNKKVYHNFPADLDVLENCEPVYEEVSGWMEDTSKVRDVKSLPGKAMDYIRKVEEIIGLKVKMVSVGPERLQIISI